MSGVPDMPIVPRAVRVAAAAAVVALLLLAACGPLYQLEFISLAEAYAGTAVAMALACGAGVSALRSIAGGIRRRAPLAALVAGLAAVLAVFTIVMPTRALIRTRLAAPVHDITTDLQNPPIFDALLDVEATASQLPRPASIDTLQRQAYPDIKPVVLPVPVDQAFEEVLETFTELDWPVADGNHRTGLIEGALRTPWFGFRDDVVVRLTPMGDQTRVDVRSVARDGGNDAGRNAEHVREFLEEVQK